MATAAHENATAFRWTPEKIRAAVLLAEDEKGEDEIAAAVGVNPSTLWRWKQHPDFAARVGDHIGRLQAGMLRYRIAKKRERLRVLDALHEKQLRVIEERATDPLMARVPGGTTGLLVRQLKSVKHVDDTADDGPRVWQEEHAEYAVDVGLLKEIRATEEQAAKELGQWVDKSEVGGTVSVVRIVGADAEMI